MKEKDLYNPETLKTAGKIKEETAKALGSSAMKEDKNKSRALGSAAIKGAKQK